MAYETAKVDERSSIGIGESMNIFSMPTIDVGIGKIRYIEYKPLNQLNQDVGLEFEVPNTGNTYIDLRRTYLTIKVKVTKASDNSKIPKVPVADGDTALGQFGPVNNMMHALFSQVDIYFQKQLVTTSNSNYAYESYLSTISKYDERSKATHLQGQLYFKDSGTMDASKPLGGNSGLTVRATYSAESNIIEMMGPIMSDVMWTNRYLLNGVGVKIRMWPTSPQFHLMSGAATPDYKTVMTDASLSVCMVTPSPQTLIAHQDIMVKKKRSAMYPYMKTDVKKYSMSQGHYCFNADNIYLGKVPNRILIGMVKEKSTVGDYEGNPYNFKHFNMKHINVTVDGESVPQKGLQMKFGIDEKSSSFMEAYIALYGRERFTDGHDEGVYVTRSEFYNGYTLLAFDMEPDVRQESDGSVWPTTKQGNLRIQIDFAEKLPEAVCLIVYATFPGLFKIDSNRAVTVIQ